MRDRFSKLCFRFMAVSMGILAIVMASLVAGLFGLYPIQLLQHCTML